MQKKVLLTEDPLEDIREEEWLVFPLNMLEGRNPQEMAAGWKRYLLQLCRQMAPEILRSGRVSPEGLPPRSPWFLYWMLPELLRRITAEKPRGVWLKDYDLPLLCGLQEGFGRYSTELISAIAESCLDAGENVLCLRLTAQIPFPLPRISWPGGGERREVDERRRCYAERILNNYFGRKGKTCWEEWLNYFKNGRKKKSGTLVTEELLTLEHWQTLIYYSQLEKEVPEMMRRQLGDGGTELVGRPETEIRRGLYQMANRWDCRSIKDMEELLQILFFCRNPEGGTVNKTGGRKNRRNIVFTTDPAGQSQLQLRLSVKRQGRQ